MQSFDFLDHWEVIQTFHLKCRNCEEFQNHHLIRRSLCAWARHHLEEPHSEEQVGWGPRLVITSRNLTLTQFSSLLLSYLAFHSKFQCSIKTFNWLNISELTPPGFRSCSRFSSEIGFFPFIFESFSCFPSLRGVHWICINMTWDRKTLSLRDLNLKMML